MNITTEQGDMMTIERADTDEEEEAEPDTMEGNVFINTFLPKQCLGTTEWHCPPLSKECSVREYRFFNVDLWVKIAETGRLSTSFSSRLCCFHSTAQVKLPTFFCNFVCHN